MTFEDMDDVSLATEHYMFSSQMDGACDLSDDEEDGFEMFHSQVDGEQDLVEQPNKKNSAGGVVHQNGVSANGGSVKVESLAQLPGVQLLVNGSASTEGTGSILARHLGLVVTKAARPDSPERTFSCDMCSAKLKNKRNFETHMKRHRGELPFKCEECPKTFQGRRDLETHKRSRHDVAKKGVSVEKEDGDMEIGQPLLLSPVLPSIRQKTIVLNMNSLPTSIQDQMNTVLIKQDPVMVADHKDEPPDPETDFILQDSLPLFDSSLMESGDSAVNLSLDDLTSFTQPLGGSLSSGGLHQDNSFDASMDGSASFLSGADMSTDTFELVGEDDNDVSGHTNSHGRFSLFRQFVFLTYLLPQTRILATTQAGLTPRSLPVLGAQHRVRREIKSFPVLTVRTSALATGNSIINMDLRQKSCSLFNNSYPQEESHEPHA